MPPLLSSILDEHGAMLEPCRLEYYHSFVLRLEEHSIGRKYKLPSKLYFLCSNPIKFIIVVLVQSFAISTQHEMLKKD